MELLALMLFLISLAPQPESDLEFLIRCYGEDMTTECLTADLNGDGWVDIRDYRIFMASDLNGDGVVNFYTR